MLLETTRFGKINYKKPEIIWMVRGLLGFDDFKRYIVVSIKGQEPFKWLQSIDDSSLAFLMIDPLCFKSDYIIEVNPKDIALLGGGNLEDITIFVLVTIPTGQPEKMSANLQGPIAINGRTMHGAQLVLGESSYSTRHFIFKEIEKKLAGATV